MSFYYQGRRPNYYHQDGHTNGYETARVRHGHPTLAQPQPQRHVDLRGLHRGSSQADCRNTGNQNMIYIAHEYWDSSGRHERSLATAAAYDGNQPILDDISRYYNASHPNSWPSVSPLYSSYRPARRFGDAYYHGSTSAGHGESNVSPPYIPYRNERRHIPQAPRVEERRGWTVPVTRNDSPYMDQNERRHIPQPPRVEERRGWTVPVTRNDSPYIAHQNERRHTAQDPKVEQRRARTIPITRNDHRHSNTSWQHGTTEYTQPATRTRTQSYPDHSGISSPRAVTITSDSSPSPRPQRKRELTRSSRRGYSGAHMQDAERRDHPPSPKPVPVPMPVPVSLPQPQAARAYSQSQTTSVRRKNSRSNDEGYEGGDERPLGKKHTINTKYPPPLSRTTSLSQSQLTPSPRWGDLPTRKPIPHHTNDTCIDSHPRPKSQGSATTTVCDTDTDTQPIYLDRITAPPESYHTEPRQSKNPETGPIKGRDAVVKHLTANPDEKSLTPDELLKFAQIHSTKMIRRKHLPKRQTQEKSSEPTQEKSNEPTQEKSSKPTQEKKKKKTKSKGKIYAKRIMFWKSNTKKVRGGWTEKDFENCKYYPQPEGQTR